MRVKNTKKERSITCKLVGMLLIFTAAMVLMCALNCSAWMICKDYNNTFAQEFVDYKEALLSGDAETIAEVEANIAYTTEHSNIKADGTYVFNIILVILTCVLSGSMYFHMKNTITKPVRRINDKIKYIADGDLTVEFDVEDSETTESKDEVICMEKSMKNMAKQLREIISGIVRISNDFTDAMNNLNEGADAISQSTSDISSAVTEVSGGAVSMAEDTQNATNIVSSIGENINDIKSNTEELSNSANNMNNAKDKVFTILNEFTKVNDDMGKNIEDTNEQINITSENVKEIQQFIEVIKGIAAQTRLLSLNAQIESARSGEAGRGFAVVATEIGKLAEQSSAASEEIEDTLNHLLNNYDLIVQKMKSTNENIVFQNTKLIETKENFDVLDEDINVTVNKIKEINIIVDDLNKLRNNMVDVISSVSAVSEENAASSQQTTASLEELSATILQMCNDIKEVKEKADVLLQSVSVFTINKEETK